MICSQVELSSSEVVSTDGVVSAGHMAEAEVGARLLAEGGSAVDAVVGAAFAAFVVEPQMCGPGGYGHLGLYEAASGTFYAVDHHARAPAALSPGDFEVDPELAPDYYGWPRVRGLANEWGPLAVGVPGAVAGLCSAQERFGSLPLKSVISPALELADRGTVVTPALALDVLSRAGQIAALPATASVLLPGGRPPAVGSRLDCSGLAATLEAVSRAGAKGFYEGPVAEAVVEAVRAGGGALSASDLAGYEAEVVAEAPQRFAGFEYVTGNEPLGTQILNLLDALGATSLEPGSAELAHIVAEALGHAFVDHLAHGGDEHLDIVPAAGLRSAGFARARAGAIRSDRAAPRPIEAADPWPYEGRPRPAGTGLTGASGGPAGTTPVVACDRAGNLAALIASVGQAFGSLVHVPGTGVFLNDAVRVFDPRPGRPNSIRGGRKPVFVAPLVLARDEEGAGVFAAAGAGGYRIATAVVTTTLYRLGLGTSLVEAVAAPRVHCQGAETFVDERVSEAAVKELRARGHSVVVERGEPGLSQPMGRVAAVSRDPDGRSLHAAGDPPLRAWAAGV